jgi:hypothetical protein
MPYQNPNLNSEDSKRLDCTAEYLKNHDWEYIVVDIRWYVEKDKSHGYNQKDAIIVMDDYGRLMPAENRFPYPTGFPPQNSLEIHLKLDKLRIKGVCKVHDLWAKEDVGEFTNELSMYVRKHGS